MGENYDSKELAQQAFLDSAIVDGLGCLLKWEYGRSTYDCKTNAQGAQWPKTA